MKHRIADLLRYLARRLDGIDGLHQLNVRAMNRYIGQTEGYIIALETAIRYPGLVNRLRRAHGRTDTKPLRDAGAWN